MPPSSCSVCAAPPRDDSSPEARSQRTPPVQYSSTVLPSITARLASTQPGSSENCRISGVSAPRKDPSLLSYL